MFSPTVSLHQSLWIAARPLQLRQLSFVQSTPQRMYFLPLGDSTGSLKKPTPITPNTELHQTLTHIHTHTSSYAKSLQLKEERVNLFGAVSLGLEMETLSSVRTLDMDENINVL